MVNAGGSSTFDERRHFELVLNAAHGLSRFMPGLTCAGMTMRPDGGEEQLIIERMWGANSDRPVDETLLRKTLLQSLAGTDTRLRPPHRAEIIGQRFSKRVREADFDPASIWREHVTIDLDGRITIALVGVPPAEIEKAQTVTITSEDFSLRHSLQVVLAGEIALHLAPTSTQPGWPETSDFFRKAGVHFLSECVASVSGFPRYTHIDNLFENINQISSLPYEGTSLHGTLVFDHSRDIDSGASGELQFEQRIPLSDVVWARKILEMSSKKLAILGEYHSLRGLIPIEATANRFSVKFVGQKGWHLMFEDRPLMQVKYGRPDFPTAPWKNEDLDEPITRIFGNDPVDRESIQGLVKFTRDQSHGALIVICGDAAEQAKHLSQCGTGTPIKPSILSEQAVRAAVRIDGALLVDCTGRCHAIGVILDGAASEGGDRSRGARYNSALRYVKSARARMALVISEDGQVNLLPAAPPSPTPE